MHVNTNSTDSVIDKTEFLAYAKNRTKYVDAHMIITNEFWSAIDTDGNGLDADEFHRVVRAFDRGSIYGTPFIVYSVIASENLKEFRAVYESVVDVKKSSFAVVPTSSGTLPYSQRSWQEWYDKISEDFGLSFSSVDVKSQKSSLVSLKVNVLPETSKYVIPMATLAKEKLLLDKHIHLSDRVSFSDVSHGMVQEMFTKKVEIRATEQLPDVVHIFNKEESETIGSGEFQSYACSPTPQAQHQGAAGCGIEDNTVVPVVVMVRFPGFRTQDYMCGLQFANVYTTELDVTQKDADGNYKVKGSANAYVADDLGRMDLAFTPGTTWKIEVDYDSHDRLCYGGDDLKVQSCEKGESGISSRASFTLEKVTGGETIVFLDMTERNVDLGLYAGACETPYEGYTLLISPANGCGSSITVSDTDIRSRSSWALIDPDNRSSNLRKWPYAAMDYYIQLETTPDVSSLTQDKLLQDEKNTGMTCAPPGGTIMDFFRERNVLVQTLLLLKSASADAKYVYHGWFCAIPAIADQDDGLYSPFTQIRPGDKCLGTDPNNPSNLDLTPKHLIGTTDRNHSTLSDSQVSEDKYVKLKIFEAHMLRPNEIEYCSDFESDDNKRLGIHVQIQEDVGSQATNPCHSKNEPSDECKFDRVHGDGMQTYAHDDASKTYGFVQFKNSQGSDVDYFDITSTDAKPNLVSPYRRTFLARIQRNDGWAVANLAVERELVPMKSKVRGGGDPSKRYNSDTKFYATAPIKGLVYTVVHDPPGGNSFASIGQGTNVEMELGLSTTRASSTGRSHSDSISGGTSITINVKPNFGSAYANVEIEADTGASLGSEPLTPSADRHQSRRLQYLRKGTGTGGGDYAGYWKKKEETSGKARNRWKDAGERAVMSENKRREDASEKMRSQWKDASERMMAENAAQKKKEEARNRWKKAGEHVKQANKVVSALGEEEEEEEEEEEKQMLIKGQKRKGQTLVC